MKKFGIIIGFTLLFIGCQADLTNDNQIGGNNTLTLSISSGRTSLGEKVGNTYPLYWSKGDKVAVNGIASSGMQIDANEPSKATFEFDKVITYPYNITYPYCEATSAEQPIVVLPTEQSYIEGSFSNGSAPMCGYATDGNNIAIKHLASVMRIPVKSAVEGVVLNKIVVSSPNKIAGEFSVNCQNATISTTANSENSITYTTNIALSATEEKIFHIAIAAVDAGACTVELIDSNGDKMVVKWNAGTIQAGVVCEFKAIEYRRGEICSLPAMSTEEDIIEINNHIAHGYVKDANDNPIPNVAVSDGFTVVQTNKNGYYSLSVSKDCWYIYISIPSEYEVPINEYGQPCFYQRFSPEKKNYDFTLKPLAGGKESKFALFVLTDLHISTSYRQARFEREALPSILKHASEVKQSIPCYGVALGDLIDNSNSKDTSSERLNVRALLANNRFGFPLFNTMGNHDNTYYNDSNPAQSDATSSTFNLKAQRDYEDVFGPVNYSFNRGDVHIVVMRNIIYSTNTTSNNYEVGFTDAQWEWLKQDLALVPKDKMVVLGTHIKMHNESKNHIAEVTALLGEYKEAHIFTGHSHIQRNYPASGSTKKVFEHNLGAICGASWFCKMGEDGTPNGYNVFIGEGATFSDWYRMAYNKRLDSRSQQMRLYRGDAVTGAAMPSAPGTTDNPDGVKGFYKFNFAENVLLANVYNADSKWSIKVYEDGLYSGDMTLLPSSNYSMSTLIGDGTAQNPFRFAADVATGQDLYTAGLLMGIQSRYKNGGPLGNCWSNNYHMYKYELKNKDAAIKVVAIDRFGNEYTETKITNGTDYTLTSGDYKTDANL